MTFEQFRHLVQPLVNRFGDKVFSFDSISLLYRKLSLITPDQMRSLVEDVLLEFHFAPSLSKIIILAKPYTSEAYEAEKKQN